jgi:hypothetical protein
MILVFNLNGDPRHALGVLLLCVLCNVGFDLLVSIQLMCQCSASAATSLYPFQNLMLDVPGI